jgi:hypothetical protein
LITPHTQTFAVDLYHRIRHTEGRLEYNRCHAMIHHQNADAMVLASARLRGIPPLDVHHFEYYQGGECLSNAHWLGPCRQHLMTNYGLRQNHRKIIGKTKKSAFCVPYSVSLPPIDKCNTCNVATVFSVLH